MDETLNAGSEAARAYRPMRSVFTGTIGEVTAMQATLSAQGFETFIEQEMTKTLDPFVTGGNVFAVTLSAPADQAPAIEAALREMKERGPATDVGAPQEPERLREEDDEESASEDAAPTLAELEALGRRIRWCTFETLLAPIALMLGATYLAGTYGRARMPARHGLTLVALVIALVELGALLWVVWWATSGLLASPSPAQRGF